MYNSYINIKGEDMLKELIFTGLGGALVFKEKIEEELKKLEEKGKIDTKDMKSFLESLEQKGKELLTNWHQLKKYDNISNDS